MSKLRSDFMTVFSAAFSIGKQILEKISDAMTRMDVPKEEGTIDNLMFLIRDDELLQAEIASLVLQWSMIDHVPTPDCILNVKLIRREGVAACKFKVKLIRIHAKLDMDYDDFYRLLEMKYPNWKGADDNLIEEFLKLKPEYAQKSIAGLLDYQGHVIARLPDYDEKADWNGAEIVPYKVDFILLVQEVD